MKLGRYEVVRELKTGGMASATLARAPDGRLVVLKRPLEHDRQLFARLRDEARVGARASHPNLVETLDIFEHEGRPVLVVGYVRGVSVHDLRKGASVPTGAVARIGWQIASCLRALHEAADENGKPFNVIHRDVSGGNILVDVGGDAHLIDLGIAKFDEGRSARTATGQIIGTVRYMAPEILGEQDASPASDVWALACVLVEAATGKPVFAGGTREVLARINNFKSVDDLSLDNVDARLSEILRGAMHVDPAKRMSALELESGMRTLEQRCGGGKQDLADLVARRAAEQAADERASAASAGATQPLTRPTEEAPTRRDRTGAPAVTSSNPQRRAAALVLSGVVLALVLVLAFGAARRARREKRDRTAPIVVVDAGVATPAAVRDAGIAAPIDAPTPKLAAVRAVDGCGAPPKVEPFFDNGDGTFQSESGFGSNGIIEVKFACPVPFVRVTVFDAHGDGHRVEAYDAGGKAVQVERLPAARVGTAVPPREVVVAGPDNITSVYLVPARADHVWYALSTAPPERPPDDAPPPPPDDLGSRLPPPMRDEVQQYLKTIFSCDDGCATLLRESIGRGGRPPLRVLRDCAEICSRK